MNLARTLRAFTAISLLWIGFATSTSAAVSVFFSSTPACTGANSTTYVPGGAPVQMSLCMTTTAPTSTCGYTAVLQSAPSESGLFSVISPLTLGNSYSDPNSETPPFPLPLANPATVADLGGTGSAAVAAGQNQLLATYLISPSASATGGPYTISLAPVSAVAVADPADLTCGQTLLPSDALISASFTLSRNLSPVFTSATAATFAANTSNTFTVSATGSPAPTLSVSGALPSGVSFTAGTGILAGTPTVNGTYPLTFTATNGAGSAMQSFTLTVSGKASQSITFPNPGTQSFSSTPIALSATASSGLPVVYSSTDTAVCTVVGTNVTMNSLGTCIINANQAGNATYLAAAQVTQSFGVVGSVPGAPTIGTATPGNGQLAIAFTAPASTGGSAISTYTANCNGISASGTSSPIIVPGLTNGTPYTCSVTATNALGTGPASASVVATPAAGALTLIAVESRKVHGSAGTFNLPITTGVPITGAVTVESRTIGTGHTIVLRFSDTITSAPATATVVDSTAAVVTNSVAFAGSEVTVTLPTLADKSRVSISLTNVNGNPATFTVTAGFLVGDQNGSLIVDAADISAVRARSGQAANTTNFRADFNASGAIDAADISTVRARSGNSLP